MVGGDAGGLLIALVEHIHQVTELSGRLSAMCKRDFRFRLLRTRKKELVVRHKRRAETLRSDYRIAEAADVGVESRAINPLGTGFRRIGSKENQRLRKRRRGLL